MVDQSDLLSQLAAERLPILRARMDRDLLLATVKDLSACPHLLVSFLGKLSFWAYLGESFWVAVWDAISQTGESCKLQIFQLALSHGYFSTLAQMIFQSYPKPTAQIFTLLEQFNTQPWLQHRNLKNSLGCLQKQADLATNAADRRSQSLKLLDLVAEDSQVEKRLLIKHLRQFKDFAIAERLLVKHILPSEHVVSLCQHFSKPQEKERLACLHFNSLVTQINCYLTREVDQTFWDLYREVGVQTRQFAQNMSMQLPHSRKLYYAWADYQTYVTKDAAGLAKAMERLVSSPAANFYDWKKYLACLKALGNVAQTRKVIQRAFQFGSGFENEGWNFSIVLGNRDQFINYYRKLNPQTVLPILKQDTTLLQCQLKVDVDEEKQAAPVKEDKPQTVFMSCFPQRWSEKDIRDFLPQELKVSGIRFIRKPKKNICYIDLESMLQAKKLVMLNGTVVEGHQLYIALSKPPSHQQFMLFAAGFKGMSQQQVIQKMNQLHKFKSIDLLRDNKGKFYGTVVAEVQSQLQLRQLLKSNQKGIKLSRYQPAQKRTLFIKNLPFNADSQTVKKHFKDQQIIRIEMPMDSQGRSKGFASVVFAEASAKQRVERAKSAMIGGRRAEFYPARERKRLKGKAREPQLSNDDFLKFL